MFCDGCSISKEQKAGQIIPAFAIVESQPVSWFARPQNFAPPAPPANLVLPVWQDADETAKLLKNNFSDAALGSIISSINASHPHVVKDALAYAVKKELEVVIFAIQSKLGSDIAKQVEKILSEVRADPVMQHKFEEMAQKSLPWPVDAHDGLASPTVANNESAANAPEAQFTSENVTPVPGFKATTFVQFGSSVYFADEEQGHCEVDVMRIGSVDGRSTVKFATADASATAGRKYEKTTGTMTFEPGELSKNINVKILSDDRWDTTLEFKVELSDAKNSEITAGLSTCRIKILDDDAFPTNKYKETYEQKGLAGLPKVKLFIEYVRMGFEDPKIREASLRLLWVDQIQNLHEVWFLFLKIYLIDVVLNPDTESMLFGDRMTMLCMICALVIIPQSIMSGCLVERVTLRVGGMSRLKLQANLLRKFLNYDECLRSAAGLSDLMLSITHHSPDLVQNGYLASLKLVQECGKMLFFIAYQLVLVVRQDNIKAAVAGFVPIIFFPLCMTLFLFVRHPKTDKLKLNMMLQEKNLASQVEAVAHSARTIIDYQARAKTMDNVEVHINTLNSAINASHGNHVVNMQFAPWLASLVIGFYILAAGQLVIDNGPLSLGTFLVTVDMYQRISHSWEKVYNVVLTMHSCLPSLELIFWHMNLPTDLTQRRAFNIMCTSMGVEERAKARQREKAANVVYAIDMLPIMMANVSFHYSEGHVLQLTKEVSGSLKSSKVSMEDGTQRHQGDDHDLRRRMSQLPGVQNISIEMQQGTLIALVGKRGEGKTTLLKIFGGVLVPEGRFYMPTHLRVVHVEQQPTFFESTLAENLRYGIRHDTTGALGHIDRLLAICRMLRVSEAVLRLIVDGEIRMWSEHLSLTQKTALHLVRALAANPDVLVMHKPMLVFDTATALAVAQTLRKFVHNRGLFVEGDIRSRRRKTCIFTSTRVTGIDCADLIVLVTKTGVRQVQAHEVADLLE